MPGRGRGASRSSAGPGRELRPQWAQPARFQELREASEAGGKRPAERAAKLRADVKGRAARATTQCFLGHFILAQAFTQSEGPTRGSDSSGALIWLMF